MKRPLGSLGPLSHDIISPNNGAIQMFQSFYSSMLGDLRDKIINNTQNPLSDQGPLGDSYCNVMPSINDLTKHMQGLFLKISIPLQRDNRSWSLVSSWPNWTSWSIRTSWTPRTSWNSQLEEKR